MPCYRPLKAWRSRTRNPSGKYGIVFNPGSGYADQKIEVACGQCVGCRLERSRQWAIRCVHEASLYDSNCFITLTYNDENLPPGNTLVLEHFQKFFKRLRKKYGEGIRFFHCGEYGERFGRPHYHACIFNHDWDDKVLWQERDDIKLYTSESLAKLWPFGFATTGELTFESAAYVARYVVKKVFGEAAKPVQADGTPGHYVYIDEVTGEVFDRKPEYVTMSRGKGIGVPWLEKYAGDVYPDDFVVLRGKKMKPPKFYDQKYFQDIKHLRDRYPKLFQLMNDGRIDILDERQEDAFRRRHDNVWHRLEVKEKVTKARLTFLKRGFEDGDS